MFEKPEFSIIVCKESKGKWTIRRKGFHRILDGQFYQLISSTKVDGKAKLIARCLSCGKTIVGTSNTSNFRSHLKVRQKCTMNPNEGFETFVFLDRGFILNSTRHSPVWVQQGFAKRQRGLSEH